MNLGEIALPVKQRISRFVEIGCSLFKEICVSKQPPVPFSCRRYACYGHGTVAALAGAVGGIVLQSALERAAAFPGTSSSLG